MRPAGNNARPRAPVWLSIGFWLCLFSGLGLFAVSFLAPRVVARERLVRDLAASSQRLNSAEQRYRQMQRTIEALRTDPEFASELARVQLDAVRTGEEVLRVPAGMGLQLTDSLPAHAPVSSAADVPESGDRRLVDLAAYVDSRPQLRWLLVLLAGVLVLLGFGLFVPRGYQAIEPVAGEGRADLPKEADGRGL
jgi:cell division protein FtsB